MHLGGTRFCGESNQDTIRYYNILSVHNIHMIVFNVLYIAKIDIFDLLLLRVGVK